MSGNTSQGFAVTQLSDAESRATSAIAVFAHNESSGIRAALESIAYDFDAGQVRIYVLANGCSDNTTEIVRECADTIKDLWLVEIELGDKANAWNLFVHDILSEAQLEEYRYCFFMDGDVWLSPNTLDNLASLLMEHPELEAAGAMPATGRNCEAWRRRMPITGMIAGNCYGLRNTFIQLVRHRMVRMPTGLVGEDFFLSWLVATVGWRLPNDTQQLNRCGFHHWAEFSFRSLSPWRISDWQTYLRRKWRYAIRGVQHHMLVLTLMEQGMAAMPRDVQELYEVGPLPSRKGGQGLGALWHLMAVQWVRRQRSGN